MRWAQDDTPELIAHVKHRYEETDETVGSIAADTGVRERKIYEWAVQFNWRKRRDRPPRDLPPELRLRADVDRALQEADTEAEAVSRAQRNTLAREDALNRADECCAAGPGPSQTPSLEQSRISDAALHAASRPRHEAGEQPPPGPSDTLSTADRLERVLEQNLTRVEHLRATQWPQNAAEAERTTRVLERLTQALLKVRQLRNPDPNKAGQNDVDMPRDIDEFRRALAQRIRAFVRSRTGAGVPGSGDARDAG